MTGSRHWRLMRGEDIPAVSAMAAAIHTDFFEDDAVYIERLKLYPAGCFVLEGAGGLIGYAISHPWRQFRIPTLNTLLWQLPDDSDTYYLHDIALLPEGRSGGLAARVVAVMVEQATRDGFTTMSLVAVNGSAGFWQKQGFSIVDAPELGEKLRTYSGDARFMMRTPLSPSFSGLSRESTVG
ncbi:GNAT family N-acetyltransferase [Phyllobacterium leguminum]|uniref:Acetyltransferase (GNAT) family protein n=1 Tax=Phyllobacterium leguminum TaxID=314237 RepID=A0A318T656_9HYPH|nr:GNAT family N-acetyltransferase [Phyllobacterium leguminum]PYE88714.1 acetyltransferase (GNAT) family protein [Phyllobacterium leguminum]